MMTPQYKIKEHARARYVGLRICDRDGLIVTVPKGFDRRRIPSILQQKRQWIDKHLADNDEKMLLPHAIELRIIEETWKVSYKKTASKRIKLYSRPSNRQLILSGDTGDTEQARERLQEWVKEAADYLLPSMLEDVSEEIGLDYAACSIRNQKSRWGSCTSKKSIQLNQKLIFFPEDFVRYIMVHELCHTVHMNHSRAFWNLVKRFEPDHLTYDNMSRRNAWKQYVPAWAL